MNVRWLGVACAAVAFALDQASKEIARTSPALASGVELLPLLGTICSSHVLPNNL